MPLNKFAAHLSALHQNSTSTTGKYGSHVIYYTRNIPQYNYLEDSKGIFFSKSIKQALDLEVPAKDHHSEFGCWIQLSSARSYLLMGSVVSNSGVKSESSGPVVFGAFCFYAHNEYEFGQWRPVCDRFGAEYLDAYHTFVKISAPEEDFDGRVDLYKLRFNTHVSALFHDNPTLQCWVI